jgi:OmpA-OmpF porin, OOP family
MLPEHRRALRFLLTLFLALAALVASPSARAQRPSIDTRTWRPSTDPNASLVVEPAVTPGPGVLSFGAYGHYSYRPITLRRAGTDDVALRPLAHSLGLDAIVNLGIGERFAVGAGVPVLLYQDGSRPLPATVSSVDAVPTAGFGDLGLSMKGAIVRNEGGGFGLAGLGYVSLPTGDRASFAGEGSSTATVRLLAEYTLLVATAQASLGYKLRTDHETWPAPEAGGVRFGDELPWTVGFALRPGVFGLDPGNRQRWELAAHGWLPAGPVGPFGSGAPGSAALSPALLAISNRIELGHYRDTYLMVGAEVGLNNAVGVPLTRFVISFGWAPRQHDMDHDGVKDDVDGCPEIPEDRDGFEDADGCPEIDNDDDGIIDREDACPNVAGVPSSDPKKHGCPIADADGDGIADEVDACPDAKGPRSSDPKRHGCPFRDQDGDGIEDSSDRCPTQAEDKDGFEDEDGCPDPDNDGDGIADTVDACPDVKGVPSSDPARHGCPDPDRDGDTYLNEADRCPDEAEVFNGVEDDDGCPDEGGTPLVTVDARRIVRLRTPIVVTSGPEGAEVAPASLVTLRALALELHRHPDWTLAVGARPAPGGDSTKAQLDALERSFAVVRELSSMSRRDGVAETVGWDAVKNQPGAGVGIAYRVLVTPQRAAGGAEGKPLPRARE